MVIPTRARSSSRSDAAAHVPSAVKVPTCSSYSTCPSGPTPVHAASDHRKADGSTISDGPCGPSGWNRLTGSGPAAISVELVAVAIARANVLDRAAEESVRVRLESNDRLARRALDHEFDGVAGRRPHACVRDAAFVDFDARREAPRFVDSDHRCRGRQQHSCRKARSSTAGGLAARNGYHEFLGRMRLGETHDLDVHEPRPLSRGHCLRFGDLGARPSAARPRWPRSAESTSRAPRGAPVRRGGSLHRKSSRPAGSQPAPFGSPWRPGCWPRPETRHHRCRWRRSTSPPSHPACRAATADS